MSEQIVTKQEWQRLALELGQKNNTLQQTNQELLEALALIDEMLRKGIFNCTDEEMQRATETRKQAITNAKQVMGDK